MDKIKIEQLHLYAYHGVHDFEKENGQNFYINACLYVDTFRAGVSDDLYDSVSYSDAAKLIKEVFTEESYDLIERAAQVVAVAILSNFEAVRKVDIEVRKPEAPIGLEIESVSVSITRQWHKVYLGVGSNLGDKLGYIQKALKLIEEDSYTRLIRVSELIETKPYGGVEQDDFVNGAIEIDTLYTPELLLEKIHEIEAECSRVREIHWGPRTLDLDILFYDDLVINTEKLTIPHNDMVNRQFVLDPMYELAPGLIHPVMGQSIAMLKHQLDAASEAAVNSAG